MVRLGSRNIRQIKRAAVNAGYLMKCLIMQVRENQENRFLFAITITRYLRELQNDDPTPKPFLQEEADKNDDAGEQEGDSEDGDIDVSQTENVDDDVDFDNVPEAEDDDE
ncbi:hypothetical protein K7X08_028655 [Anisodus acutangulus]|uniref:Uncharacterized protein n=1 Tax=Anisodus acutangulus TaxID=402998 RepID=A0A9Q1R7Y9_9SOLA|nr:hypothetical protein K7X08_028655 [Anisodus acutangulus]